MIPEKITFRLGHLAGPLGEWCDKHQIKPSEAARRAVAAMLGVDAPEMPVGNPDAGETLAAQRWKPKRKKRSKRSKE